MNARRITTLTLKQARRVTIFVVGVTVGLLGLVMLVTPGPGLAGIALGLAILAVEFAWAKRLLADAKARMHAAGRAVRQRTGRGARGSAPAEPVEPALEEPPAAGRG